jgi:glutathione S-transferase
MITLYHAPTTRSFRIKWLLKELELPYVERLVDFYGTDRHSPEYRRINPMGSMPAMQDGDLTLTESGAIINHIIRNHGGGRFAYPRNSAEEAMVDEWMFWSEGLFAVHQRMYWDHGIGAPGCINDIDKVPSVGEYGKRYAIRYAIMVERALRDDGFMVGDDLTGADFMLCHPLFLANLENWFADLPRIKAYVDRFAARPAFKAALEDTMLALEKFTDPSQTFESFRSFEPDGVWSLATP